MNTSKTLIVDDWLQGSASQPHGYLSSAIRALQDVIDEFEEPSVKRGLSRLAHLYESGGDLEQALSTLEVIGYIDHSRPRLIQALRRVRCGLEALARVGHAEAIAPDNRTAIPLAPTSSVSSGLGSRRLDAYNLVDYIRYEFGSPAVEAKKALEMDCMTSVMKQLARSGLPKVSLDIGCATGRWPLWIARQGYECHGYDISGDAIELCKKQAAAHPALRLAFELHDIADGVPRRDYFSLVTCMMGTINHVESSKRGDFLQGISSTMKLGGTFAFTSWNGQSPFCDFLNIDSREAKDFMRRNMGNMEDLLGEVHVHGFDIVSIVPLCFLPNQCFEAWESSFSNFQVITEVDEYLRERLAPEDAQMYFVQCEKRQERQI